MGQYKPKPHEETFDVKPVGVKYICEFCNEGEMLVDDEVRMVLNIESVLIPHRCTKCGKILQLPKSYPYIEWVPVDGKEDTNETE